MVGKSASPHVNGRMFLLAIGCVCPATAAEATGLSNRRSTGTGRKLRQASLDHDVHSESLSVRVGVFPGADIVQQESSNASAERIKREHLHDGPTRN